MLTNLSGNQIRYVAYDLTAGETSESVTVRVTDVQPGTTLLSEQSDSVVLKAREAGSLDPYVDLADGIDLSGYTPGSSVDFEIVCAASEELTGLIRVALFLGVVTSGSAAWTV